jgi:hypothetical protein
VGLISDFAPKAAIVVPIGDDAELATVIASVRDPEARRSLAEKARERAHCEGLAARTAGRLLDLYRRLASRSEDGVEGPVALEGSGRRG